MSKEIRFNDAVIAIAQYLQDNDYSVRIKFFNNTNSSGVELIVDGENEFPEEQMNDMSLIISNTFEYEFYWGSGLRKVIMWNND